ncbi:hypothetical protein A8U91_01885 [Halomonas elongata]|uniref:Uncharacterized protein n=1 Tax=Halomonas elongata TaxID=2746 RepID=A0A1B8P5K3_HALEL|nr:hypothetical protein A8U91_01885 [Halomonas elongata]
MQAGGGVEAGAFAGQLGGLLGVFAIRAGQDQCFDTGTSGPVEGRVQIMGEARVGQVGADVHQRRRRTESQRLGQAIIAGIGGIGQDGILLYSGRTLYPSSAGWGHVGAVIRYTSALDEPGGV